jgi:hypothetical protein
MPRARRLSAILVCLLIAGSSLAARPPRLLVLTDIGGDPDDQQSLVRLLVHANEFEIEGLVASASGTPGELKKAVTRPDLIREQISAYGEVLPNLSRHAKGFPSVRSLLDVVKSGNPQRGRGAIGEGHDTEGSRWIIARADKADTRPLNITIWGGQTDLAQALWRVRQDRGADGFASFASRLRVFDINDQDKIQEWLFAEFPDVFYVLSKAPKGADKRQGAYRGMYLGGDESLTSLAWLDGNVRKNHGPLGALYPPKTWTAPNRNSALKEGDTPSWFFFLANGLNDSSHPEWGGFGGRYVRDTKGLYRDAKDAVGDVIDARAAVWRWRPVAQNEFAARLDWCVTDNFQKANHAPIVALNGDTSRTVVEIAARSGETVKLSSSGSSDPDADPLRFEWFVYREAGTYSGNLPTDLGGEATCEFVAPLVKKGQTIHVILRVRDNGKPALTAFRRAIVTVSP